MTTISSFPLFNLPLIAIHDVLKETMPLELIQLLSTSKKVKAVVKPFIKRNSTKINYKLVISLFSLPELHEIILSHGNYEPFKIRFLTKNNSGYTQDTIVPTNFDGVSVSIHANYDYKIFKVFCKNYRITFKNMLQYLCKMFNPIMSVYSFDNEHSEALDVIRNVNAKLDELKIFDSSITDNLYQEFLDLSIRNLTLFPYPSNSFQYKPSEESWKFEELIIRYAQWVTNLEDFLQCKSVVLYDTSLSRPDLKKFLEKWMESDFQLEYLKVGIQMNELNLSEIIEELSVEPLNRVYVGNKFENFEDGKCFSFQKNNGAKAIIYQYDKYIVLHTDTYRYSRNYL